MWETAMVWSKHIARSHLQSNTITAPSSHDGWMGYLLSWIILQGVPCIVCSNKANLTYDGCLLRQCWSKIKPTYFLLYTGIFDYCVENMSEIFTSMRPLDVPEHKQSRPQDQLTIWYIAHNKVCSSAKEWDKVWVWPCVHHEWHTA